MKSILLAIETSTAVRSIAILRTESISALPTVIEKETKKKDVRYLFNMIEEILYELDLEMESLQAVAFGQGPGSFTGARIACSIAQSFSFARKIPIVPIVSHQAIAEQHKPNIEQIIVVASDAKLAEVYLSAYQVQPFEDSYSWVSLQEPMLISYNELISWTKLKISIWSAEHFHKTSTYPEVLLTGNAWEIEEIDSVSNFKNCLHKTPILYPRASSIALLANKKLGMMTEDEKSRSKLAFPLYIREKVAFTLAEQVSGKGGNPKTNSIENLHPKIMTKEDLDEVISLEKKMQLFLWTKKSFSDSLLDPTYDSFVLRNNNGILIGFSVAMKTSNLTNLLTIAIEPHYQRKNLGTLLLSWCEKQAKIKKTSGVFLEVRESNKKAISFYKKHGYSHIDTRKEYFSCTSDDLRENIFIMQKKFYLPCKECIF